MAISPLAGKLPPAGLLIDVAKLERAYYERKPDASVADQKVSFGTSGHRGTSLQTSFNENHILAITQAICDYRKSVGTTGPLYLGKDTHVLSGPASRSALEVLAGNAVETRIQSKLGFTPTPVISHAILTYNLSRVSGLADGIVITPSHNPPEDGGFKYNPTDGGPADSKITTWIQNRANEILKNGCREVKRSAELSPVTCREKDFLIPYVMDLKNVLDMDVIRKSGISMGVDPLGGASVYYWEPIQEIYKLNLTVVSSKVDPTFSFMTLDHDGKIRMDCSSPYAMAGLVQLKDRFQIAFGNDTDCDRHGIVTPAGGLMNPNHYLAVAIEYLLTNRSQWNPASAVGKTMVSSGMIDRVVNRLQRKLMEVPVGFKWFAPGLFDGSICFGGEESAGASFLRRDGKVWTTDKDGMIMDLLAAEMTARTGSDPQELYYKLTREFGETYYTRLDRPATPELKLMLQKMSPAAVTAPMLANDPILQKLTHAPGNGAALGGLKVTTENGWFAARPSGTENIYKIYAESFKSAVHLDAIVHEAEEIVLKSSTQA